MKITQKLGTVALALVLGASGLGAVGCGGTQEDARHGGQSGKPGQGPVLSKETQEKYNAGLAEMARLDKSNGWNDEACKATAQLFLDAAGSHDGFLAPAVYNAGVAYQRCNNRAEASKYYKQVLDKDPKFHRARVPLAMFAFADSNETAVDPAISEISRAVLDSEYQNVEALVNLARLQMRRDNTVSDGDGANDFDRAKKNLQRALAVDDGYMPAFNQLAIYYLNTAKRQAGQKQSNLARGAKKGKVDTQALDLALLVTSQAIRKNPNFAAVYNTAGLIAVEQGNLNQAVQSFGIARGKDPGFFEAHMNFAAVNMQFRGFDKAEEAYRAALKLKPNDYDAHLGLALALRGQINDSNFDAKLKESEAELEAAKKIDDARPEAYFNQAILTQEYKAKSGDDKSNQALEAAMGLFDGFVKRATGKPEFADALEDVTAVATKPDSQCIGPKAKTDKACKKGRISNIKEIIEFNKQSAADRKKMEEEQKLNDAANEAAAGSGDAGAAAPEGEKK
jgi:tetratricopeptide (TPR) repeat protein